jgi:hypothetical protein
MKVKATVQVTITLPRGAEIIDNIQAEGEDIGAHIKAGGKLFRPFVNWSVFEPRFLRTKAQLKIHMGQGWRTCDDADYEKLLSDEQNPDHPYTLEIID